MRRDALPDVVPQGSLSETIDRIVIRFTPPADKTPRTATLHIVCNDLSHPIAIPDFLLQLLTTYGVADIATVPEVDFGFVKAPGTAAQTFPIENLGTVVLRINAIDPSALDDSFKQLIAGTEYPSGAVIGLDPDIAGLPRNQKRMTAERPAHNQRPSRRLRPPFPPAHPRLHRLEQIRRRLRHVLARRIQRVV